MVELLHNGDLVAVGGGFGRSGVGCTLDGGALGGSGGGISGGAASGQTGHHSGGGQNSNELFHGNISLICKYQFECVGRSSATCGCFTNSGLPSLFHQVHFHVSLSPQIKNKTALAQNYLLCKGR